MGLTSSTPREPVSPHGLQAGFITQAYQAGLRDEAIMDHTRYHAVDTMRCQLALD